MMMMKMLWSQLFLVCLLVAMVGQGIRPTLVRAQDEPCTVQVYYGDGGTDQGNCLDATTGRCASRAYALEQGLQGLQVCQGIVKIFENEKLIDIYRTPSYGDPTLGDRILVVLYWGLPAVIAGIAGWLLGKRRIKILEEAL